LEFAVLLFGTCLLFGACHLELDLDLVLVIWNLFVRMALTAGPGDDTKMP
jgi:hypothetical protein